MGKLTRKCNIRMIKRMLAKAIILSILIFSSFNCAYNLYENGNWWEIDIPKNLQDELDSREKTNDTTLEEDIKYISNWVILNINYQVQYNARPLNEVIKSKRGDCTDRATVFLALVKQIYGIGGTAEVWRTDLNWGYQHTIPVILGHKFYTSIEGVHGKLSECLYIYDFQDIQDNYFSFY